MIIGLCGRIGSGKTMLGQICEENGYKRLYFALPLKQLCAEMLNVSIDKLNIMKNNNEHIDFYFTESICSFIAERTNLSYKRIAQIALNKHVYNVRDLLQYLGTEIIRRLDNDWHVNMIEAMIKPNENYVIDDVRYPNEKKMIDRLGGHCWYIIRLKIDNISNHSSETSLTFHHCWDKIIFNLSDAETLKNQWRTFLQDYFNNVNQRDIEIKKIIDDGFKDDIDSKMLYKDLLISPFIFNYYPRTYNIDTINKVILNEDNLLFLFKKDSSIEVVDNPLEIEELKRYLK